MTKVTGCKTTKIANAVKSALLSCIVAEILQKGNHNLSIAITSVATLPGS